jgi:hypothetical protein
VIATVTKLLRAGVVMCPRRGITRLPVQPFAPDAADHVSDEECEHGAEHNGHRDKPRLRRPGWKTFHHVMSPH